MTQPLSVCACRRGRARRLDHDGVRIVTRYRMRARSALSQVCRPKLHNSNALHVVRAMRRGVSRQNAFLILKLARYSSGFAGSNDLPITENDLYDVAGVPSISATRRERVRRLRGRFTFWLPPGWCRSALLKRDCAAPLRLPPVRRFAVAQLKTSRCDSPRCRVVPVVFPENWKRRSSISLSA